MEPFLAVFTEPFHENGKKIMCLLEKNTPVDFLVITENEGTNNTYRYATKAKFLETISEIQNDYASILIFSDGNTFPNNFEDHLLNQASTQNPIIALIDPTLKTVSSKLEFDEELMRFFSLNGFQILINNAKKKFVGLTLTEFESLTASKCQENHQELDKMLRSELPMHIMFFNQNLAPFSFLQNQLTPQCRGVIRLQTNASAIDKTGSLPLFTMVKPDIELWVYSKPFATLGSLTFDLQKALKEIGCRKEAIKSGSFTQNASVNEQNLLFLDEFSPDNELELSFNMDTIREELSAEAAKQGFQLLGERISKSARLLLLKKNI